MQFDELSGQQSVRVNENLFSEVETEINAVFEDTPQDGLTDSEVATIAIAVGFENGRRLSSDPPTKPFKLDSLDQEKILRTLIERRHQNASPDELRDILAEYMQGGLQTLADSIENGKIEYKDYFYSEK